MRDTQARSERGIHPSRFNVPLYALLLTLALGAAGCVSSEPDYAAGRALDAVRQGKLEEFQKRLTLQARWAIGTRDGMETIRHKLAQYTNLSIGPALLVSSRQGDQGYGHFGDIRRTYKTIVAGSPRKGAPAEAIYTLLLKCYVSYEVYHHDEVPDSCTTTIDANNVPWTNCGGGSPASDSIDFTETCSLANVEEAQASGAE